MYLNDVFVIISHLKASYLNEKNQVFVLTKLKRFGLN